MQRRLLPIAFSAILLLIIIGIGCTKLDTTTLGSDLVTVDNVNTFADSLDINSTQFIFDDSTSIQKNENHVIGKITTDPLFGNTEAAVYVQFKPTFYPYYFGNAGDTVKNGTTGMASPNAGFDSAVLCLSYKGAWGDTSSAGAIAQKFEVREIFDLGFKDKPDTVRKSLKYRPLGINPDILGSRLITPNVAKARTVYAKGVFKDSVDNQIRIKFDTPEGIAFAKSIFNTQDSSSNPLNNGFRNDSIFRRKFHGFAVTVTGPGNTLFYVNLAEAKSRLEFHYHKTTNNGRKDSVMQAFQMYPTAIGNTAASSSANYVGREHAGFPVSTPDLNNKYLQTSPGTYINLEIPKLTNYSNRIVHRAYLIVEQTPHSTSIDNIYTAPPFLYVDLKDSVSTLPQKYKPVYFDLSTTVPYNPDAKTATELFHPFPAANVDIGTFGGNALKRFEPSGVPFARYEINLTRYVQHIVTNGYRNYDLRLYAPFNYYYPQYPGPQIVIPYFNPIALGRVRVGAGSTQNIPHKMRLVVIYSKI